MLKQLRIIIVFFLILALFAFQGCKGGAEDKDVIKMGVLIPLSHGYGKSIKQGMDLAVKEINEKGLLGGKKIKLIYEDSAFNPKQSITKTKKLLTKDKVQFFIGGLASGVTKAIAGIVKKHKPIMVWGGAASTGVEKMFEGADWFFHLHPWSYYNVAETVKFFKSTPAKTVAVLYEDSEFGTDGVKVAEKFLKENNLKIVMKTAFKSGSGKFEPILTKVKSIKPDILYVICYGKDVTPFMKQMRNLNVNVKMVYPVPPSWPEEFIKMPLSEYVSALILWAPGVKNEETKEFLKKFKAMHNRKPELYWAPMGYVNVKVIAEAIKRAGSLKKDALIKELAATDMKTPMGKLTFKPSRVIKHQGFTEWMSFQWRSGEMKIVYPREFADSKLVYPMPKWSERKNK